MAPGGVRVAVRLALRAVVVEEPLTVRPSGKVARVDGYLAAHLGVMLAERGGECVEAVRDSLTLGAKLASEAVAGPMRGRTAERL